MGSHMDDRVAIVDHEILRESVRIAYHLDIVACFLSESHAHGEINQRTVFGCRDLCATQSGADVAPFTLVLQLRAVEVDGGDVAAGSVDGKLERVGRVGVNRIGAIGGDDFKGCLHPRHPQGERREE